MRRFLPIAALLLPLTLRDARAAESPFAVIVSADVPAGNLTRDVIEAIYRRRQNFWSNGSRVQPANLPANDTLRRAFSQCILGQTPEQTEGYWREMYFHGVLPPHVVASEQAMAMFVASNTGAVGYVAACPPDPGYVVVLTFGNVPNCPRHPATCAVLQE